MMGPYWNGGGWWWMGPMMVLFMALVIVGIVALVRFVATPSATPRVSVSETPLEILRRRYAAGELTKPGGVLDKLAQAHNATTSQVAIAWLLRRSPVMLPIPGTSRVKHLEENVAAAELKLSEAEWQSLEEEAKKAA